MDEHDDDPLVPEPEDPEAVLRRTNSIRAFDNLGAFLEEDGWYPQRVDEYHGYWVNYSGTNSELRCFVQIRIDLAILLCYTISPVKVPEELRPAAAEFFSRANYGMNIGNFELHMDDGRVRYKTSLDFEGVELAPSLIRNALYPSVQTMNRYLPGLLKMLYGGLSAEEAIHEVEG